ncbi:hypothetical protein K438DRAFT_281105 [Mycena galopus ATCC 62051]|nr:hypothetical protein K438DRAFT_281105 [Mycena galopus ATCC 62051]
MDFLFGRNLWIFCGRSRYPCLFCVLPICLGALRPSICLRVSHGLHFYFVYRSCLYRGRRACIVAFNVFAPNAGLILDLFARQLDVRGNLQCRNATSGTIQTELVHSNGSPSWCRASMVSTKSDVR